MHHHDERPVTVNDAVVWQLYEIDALEAELVARYKRELSLLETVEKRNKSLQECKAEIASLRGRVQRLERIERSYEALKTSKLGTLQRRWWQLRRKS